MCSQRAPTGVRARLVVAGDPKSTVSACASARLPGPTKASACWAWPPGPFARRERYAVDDEQAMVFEGFLLFFDPPKAGRRRGHQATEAAWRRAEDHHRRQSSRRGACGAGRRAQGRTHPDRRRAARDARRGALARGPPDRHLRGGRPRPEGAHHPRAAACRARGWLSRRRYQRCPGAARGRRRHLGGHRRRRRARERRLRPAAARPDGADARDRRRPARLRQHVEVRLHDDERQLRQHDQHGRAVAGDPVPAAAAEADPAQQLPVGPAGDGDPR